MSVYLHLDLSTGRQLAEPVTGWGGPLLALQHLRAALTQGSEAPVAFVTSIVAGLGGAGLARCAAFIVAARSLTLGRDLERRAFLHSYDRAGDADGAVLETVLTGPMVVAQWISAAYYFSTVDPDVFGAGDKVAHNVVAGVAVYQGAGGDLRVGLPRQAVFDGDRPYHEPMRLLVVVDAPRSRIDSVVDRNQVLGDLIDGQWIHLAARDEDGFWLRSPGSGWPRWQAAADAVDAIAAVGPVPPGDAHPPQKEVITRG